MTFPHLKYKEFSAADFGSWQGWVDAVNRAKEYCKTCAVDEWKGLCKEGDLPSFHPWWTQKVNEDRAVLAAALEQKYQICKDDPSQIKYLFNATTTLDDILKKIQAVKNRMNVN